jgi:aldose 1-epimerase
VNVTVKYTVTNDNVFLIETEAISDPPTPINLKHHSYFNLAGDAHASIADHELQIYADQFVVTDEHMTLLGRTESVSGCGNDFRRLRFLPDAVPLLFRHHGDLYVIRRSPEESENCTLIPAARSVRPDSGRILDVSITTTRLQVYMGAGLDGSLIGKSGVPYQKHAGICLECLALHTRNQRKNAGRNRENHWNESRPLLKWSR